jgi:formylglycine-generating enzyme required for sulfatase activity
MKRLIFLPCIILFAFISSKSDIPKLPKSFAKNYVYLPAGKFEVFKDSTVVLQHFFMSKTEVSNGEYRKFIEYLKSINDAEKLSYCYVDSSRWKDVLAHSENFINHYFANTLYNDYPVVNISYEAATQYCRWLSDSLNRNNNEFKYEVTLPSRVEWLRATTKGTSVGLYAWNGLYLTHSGKKYYGQTLCNHTRFSSENIRFNEEKGKYELVPGFDYDYRLDTAYRWYEIAGVLAPVKSYWPSVNGAYNMNGNVAEMVLEKGIAVGGSWRSGGYDVRNESFVTYKEPSPTIGFRPIIRIIERPN